MLNYSYRKSIFQRIDVLLILAAFDALSQQQPPLQQASAWLLQLHVAQTAQNFKSHSLGATVYVMLDQKTCEVQRIFTCAFEFLLGRSRCCLRSMDFAVASLRAAASARARTIAAAASSSCAFHCAMAAASAASFAASSANFSFSSACLQCQYQCQLIKIFCAS